MKNNLFLNHCTRFSSVVSVFFGLMAIKAQVGINTDKPESMLEVKGDIKIGNENKAEQTGKAGMLRWSDTKKCFEGHNGEVWSCLDNFRRPREQKLLLKLSEGPKLSYSDDKGWIHNTENVVKDLKATEGAETNIYNSGTITIPRDGLYQIRYLLRIYNKGESGSFDGNGGIFDSWIKQNDQKTSIASSNILKGAYINVGRAIIENNDNQLIYLNKGDKIQLMFKTYGTMNMNDNKDNIILDLSNSELVLYEIL